MTPRTWFLVYPALLLAAACGDDSSDSDAIESGLASDKPLATLTEQEANQLCDATLDAFSDLYPHELQVETACATAGVTFAIKLGPDGPRVDLAACEQARDACILEANKSPAAEVTSCGVTRQEGKSTCTATVGEFERCATASIRAGARWAEENMTCQAFAKQTPVLFPTSEPMKLQPIHVAECDVYEAKCGPFDMSML